MKKRFSTEPTPSALAFGGSDKATSEDSTSEEEDDYYADLGRV